MVKRRDCESHKDWILRNKIQYIMSWVVINREEQGLQGETIFGEDM
jgi:hypothetical protein